MTNTFLTVLEAGSLRSVPGGEVLGRAVFRVADGRLLLVPSSHGRRRGSSQASASKGTNPIRYVVEY